MARPADSTGCPWCHTHWTFQDVNRKPRWLLRQLRRATPAPGLSGNSGPGQLRVWWERPGVLQPRAVRSHHLPRPSLSPWARGGRSERPGGVFDPVEWEPGAQAALGSVSGSFCPVIWLRTQLLGSHRGPDKRAEGRPAPWELSWHRVWSRTWEARVHPRWQGSLC